MYCFYDPFWFNRTPLDFLFLPGLIFVIVILYHFIKQKKHKTSDSQTELITHPIETDVLGLEKQFETDLESYSTLKDAINWRAALLIVLLAFGMYLVLTNGALS